MSKDVHPSVSEITEAYFTSSGVKPRALDSWYFCDNEKDANECAELALLGIKRATTSSLTWYQQHDLSLPCSGDLNIVTNWHGDAKCIIQTKSVSIVRFNEITKSYAELEGEGDKSLEYWRRVHWDYYKRELSEFAILPTHDMHLICEVFDVVYKSS